MANKRQIKGALKTDLHLKKATAKAQPLDLASESDDLRATEQLCVQKKPSMQPVDFLSQARPENPTTLSPLVKSSRVHREGDETVIAFCKGDEEAVLTIRQRSSQLEEDKFENLRRILGDNFRSVLAGPSQASVMEVV